MQEAPSTNIVDGASAIDEFRNPCYNVGEREYRELTTTMDDTDRRIVNLLCENGRRSNVELARELDVSEGTIRKRIERLISTKVLCISGMVSPPQVGYRTRALVFAKVELAHSEQVGTLLGELPEVVNVYWITGEYDFVIDAVFESDRHLMSFLTERLSLIPGIVHTQTGHVLRVQRPCVDWPIPEPPLPRILIVDDDPDFCDVTRTVLERHGYHVRTVASGEQALRAMVAMPPNLVVMDIMMDGVLDGWDASWRIRSDSKLRSTPILVVSSITASDYLSMFPTDEDNLVDNFLSKPVSPHKLLEEVERLIERD